MHQESDRSERHAYWRKLIEDQAQGGLSRREFCERYQIVLSQLNYYYLFFKKKQQKNLSGMADMICKSQNLICLLMGSMDYAVWLKNTI